MKQLFTERVMQSPDGKYRWARSVNLLTNMSIFLHLMKVLTLVALGLLLGVLFIMLTSGGLTLIRAVAGFFIALSVAWGVGLLSYIIYCYIRGGSFMSYYTMDEHGISELFAPHRKEDIENIGITPGLAGFTPVRATNHKTNTTVRFEQVRSLKYRQALGHIKLSMGLEALRVYVPEEDFAFVSNFLAEHCPRVKG